MGHKQYQTLLSVLATAGMGFLLVASQVAAAASFTLAPGSPSLFTGPGFTPSDIFVTPGPVGGPPTLAVPGAAMGLAPHDNIDAMAFGPILTMIAYSFSVDPFAIGAAGSAVGIESSVAQQAGDVYTSFGAGMNTLATNQDLAGLVPPVPSGIPGGAPFIDDIDSLEANSPTLLGPATPLIFSVDPFSPLLGAFPGTGPADLFVTAPGGTPVPFIPAAVLGLLPGDDIDALMFDITATSGLAPVFSLAPGSPTLALLGFSEGDLLIAGPGLFMSATSLGLLPLADNLNAATFVPLPAPIWLLGCATAVLFGLRRPPDIA